MPTGTTTPDRPDTTEFRMNGRGVVDLTGEKARITMRIEPLGEFEMRMFDTTVYQKMPQPMRTQMPGMKPWVKSDLDSTYEQQLGASFSEIQANNPTDPTQQLEALRDGGSVEKIGQEKVRDVPTTHYHAIVDFEKMAEEDSPEVQKAYDKIIEQMGTSKVPTEVWIDEQGRLRRVATDMTMNVPMPADPAAGGSTTEEQIQFTMTQDIFDFGVPVNVSPPPPEQTMSQKELEQQMQQQMPQQQAAPAAKS